LPVLYTKLQSNFVDLIKKALHELSVIMMHVIVSLKIFSDIKRNSGSVQLVAYSMITFVSIATLCLEYRGDREYIKTLLEDNSIHS